MGKTTSSEITVCCYLKYKSFKVSFGSCTEKPKGLDTDQIKAEFKRITNDTLIIEDLSC